MKQMIFTLAFLLSIISLDVLAQNSQITLFLEDVEIDAFSVNKPICIDIAVANFTNIVGYQFGITYDPSKLVFNNCKNFLYNEFHSHCNHIPSKNTIKFIGVSKESIPYTAPDGKIINELCFDAISDLIIEENDCSTIVELKSLESFDIEIYTEDDGVIENNSGADLNINSGSICMIEHDDNIGGIENVCVMDNSMGSCIIAPFFGTPPYTANFIDCDDATIAATLQINTLSITVDDLAAGNYCMEITDSSTPVISVSEEFEITSGVSWETEMVGSDVNCNNSDGSICALITSSDLVDPSTAFNYEWLNGSQSNCAHNMDVGLYGVIISEKATGCTSTEALTIGQAAAEGFINVDLGTDILATPGDKIELTPTVNLLGMEATYNWSPASILSCTDCPNPSLVGLTATNNVVNLTVSDEFGCIAHDQINIQYDKTSGSGNTPTNDIPTAEMNDSNFQNIWNNAFFVHDDTYQVVLTDISGRILLQQSRWTSVEALQEAVRTLNIANNQLYIGAFWRLGIEKSVSKKQFYLFQK